MISYLPSWYVIVKMARYLLSKNKITIYLILFGGIVFGATTGAFFALTYDLPQIRSFENFRPSAITRIYSSDNVLLSELFSEKRYPIPYDQIPDEIKKALICTEDRSFYEHSGVDLKGILRAIIKDVQAGKFVEGASTITQQLAKTLFLTNKKTLVRKLKEAILSFQLERRYTKDEILGFYLNQVYFGSGAYGIESAARNYFGKNINELTLSECALIAGMPKAPSRYSPLVNRDLAERRRNIVLKQMLITGAINDSVYNKSINEPIHLSGKNRNSKKAPYFIAYVKNFLEETIGSTQLYKSGLIVHTTLSYDLQEVAEKSVINRLAELEQRMKKNGITAFDSQSGLIAIDVISGSILAMVGGRDFTISPFNRVIHARRQPGSAFKPILYADAVEKGFSQNMIILDAPIEFEKLNNGKSWRPENFSKTYLGGITLRKALTHSKNIPAVRLIEKIGVASVVDFSHSLGISSRLSPYLSLALGTSEVTLIELTSAYAVFPNRGEYVKPFGITEVLDYKGRIIWRSKLQKRIVMSRAGAAIITDMLMGAVKEGTGKKAQILHRQVGGKTGTTNNYKDAYFIGFSPTVVTGVWVGRDSFKTLGNLETGARAALPIWIDFMKKALEKKNLQYFDIPDDVMRVRMDSSTGKLVGDDSQQYVFALIRK